MRTFKVTPNRGDFWSWDRSEIERLARAECERMGLEFVRLEPLTTGLWCYYEARGETDEHGTVIVEEPNLGASQGKECEAWSE